MNNLIFSLVTIFSFNLIFFIFYKNISSILKVYDYPDGIRKKHSKPVPLIGGLQLLLNIYIIYFLNHYLDIVVKSFQIEYLLFFGSLIFVLGIIDDKFDIKASLKFLLLLLIILLLLNLNKDLVIRSLYFDTFDLNIYLGKYSIFFTLLCFLLFINSCNMFDGADLQLGVYSFQIFFFFFINNIYSVFSLLLLIFVFFFILLNRNSQIFLGDSGSLLVSFVISYLVISQYNLNLSNLSCELIFIIMLLPGLDMLRLFIVRIYNKKNPFLPDRKHIHHLLNQKFSKFKSTLIIQAIIFSGFFMSYFFELFLVIICLCIFYIMLLVYLNKLIYK